MLLLLLSLANYSAVARKLESVHINKLCILHLYMSRQRDLISDDIQIRVRSESEIHISLSYIEYRYYIIKTIKHYKYYIPD